MQCGDGSAGMSFADRAQTWARLDRAVVVPWTLLWVSIIKRHWHLLSYLAIVKSFCFFVVIISPSYLQVCESPRHEEAADSRAGVTAFADAS
jgi:hypothetical protein